MDEDTKLKIDHIHDLLLEHKIPERVATLEERSKNHTYHIRTIWGLFTASAGGVLMWLLDKLGGK